MSKLKDANKKIEDKFVDKYLKKDGETTEEAKERIKKEQEEAKEKQEKEAEERRKKKKTRRINEGSNRSRKRS